MEGGILCRPVLWTDQALTESDGFEIWQKLSFGFFGTILVLSAGAERPKSKNGYKLGIGKTWRTAVRVGDG